MSKQLQILRKEYKEIDDKIDKLNENSKKILMDANGNIFSVLIGFTEMNIRDIKDIEDDDGTKFLELAKTIKKLVTKSSEEVNAILKDYKTSSTKESMDILKEIKNKV